MTHPRTVAEARERPLIEAILRAYHTTRISDGSPVPHILSKPYVQAEFAALATSLPAHDDVEQRARELWKKHGTLKPSFGVILAPDEDSIITAITAALSQPSPALVEAAKISLLVLTHIDRNSLHPNMVKDLDYAIEANRKALGDGGAR